jgi:hypothetical protein
VASHEMAGPAGDKGANALQLHVMYFHYSGLVVLQLGLLVLVVLDASTIVARLY